MNVDFNDVHTVMNNGGTAIMGYADAEGEGRAIKVAEEALACPLLNDNNIHGASQILLYITSGTNEITMDEIGEISPSLQTKLLRFLQEREFEKVGDTKTIRVDVRICAATNKDLEREVKLGHFREDLYFRLNVIDLHMPSLRHRPEDILTLAEQLLARSFASTGRKPRPGGGAGPNLK